MRRSGFGGAVLLWSSTDDSGRFDASPPPKRLSKRLPEATHRSDIFDYPYCRQRYAGWVRIFKAALPQYEEELAVEMELWNFVMPW